MQVGKKYVMHRLTADERNANAMRRHPSQGPSRRLLRPAGYRLQSDQEARERKEQSNQSNDAEPLVFSR
jgi:hypothetical protein